MIQDALKLIACAKLTLQAELCRGGALKIPKWRGGEIRTIFVSLAKWRKKPTKETIDGMDRNWEHLKPERGNLLQAVWTFRRYDAVAILEARNEKTALKALMRGWDHLSIETALAIPRSEAVKLLDLN